MQGRELIDKETAEKARKDGRRKIANEELSYLTDDELLVLLADVTAELSDRRTGLPPGPLRSFARRVLVE